MAWKPFLKKQKPNFRLASARPGTPQSFISFSLFHTKKDTPKRQEADFYAK